MNSRIMENRTVAGQNLLRNKSLEKGEKSDVHCVNWPHRKATNARAIIGFCLSAWCKYITSYYVKVNAGIMEDDTCEWGKHGIIAECVGETFNVLQYKSHHCFKLQCMIRTSENLLCGEKKLNYEKSCCCLDKTHTEIKPQDKRKTVLRCMCSCQLTVEQTLVIHNTKAIMGLAPSMWSESVTSYYVREKPDFGS